MKETIIFSYTNQFALLRLLAQYGVNTVGYRVFDSKDILSFIREKTGNLSSKKMINNKEKACLYNKFLEEDNSYFKGISFDSAKSLSETIDSIRMLITKDEEKEFDDKLTNNIVFKEKYEAINKFYKKYIKYLNKNNQTDNIQEIRDILKLNIKLELEVIIIKGEELSPLNKKLLETCFSSVKEVEYRDLFNKEKTKVNFKNLYKSKGFVHEVSNVFKIISDNKFPLDQCTIVYTDHKTFYNPIKEYSTLLSLPVTYIDGVPALEFNSYRMLYLITKLNDGLYGYDVLMNLIKDKSFNYEKLIQNIGITSRVDSFLKQLGDLKFSFDISYNDKVYNDYITYNHKYKNEIEKFKDIFNKGIVDLIKEYLIDDDPSVTSKLLKDLELYRSINNKDDFSYLKSIISTLINGSLAKEGTMSFCSINKVKENVRKNMFFIGNDSDSYHISLAENSFISDDKLEEFDKNMAKTSIKIANNKIEAYKEAIQLAYDLGSNVYLSYSEKDETELKNHNLISSVYELHKQTDLNINYNDFKKKFEPVNSYYGNSFRKEEPIIEKYLDKKNTIVNEEVIVEEEKEIKGLTEEKYSPTSIEKNINCKKRFLIENILKVDGENDYDVFKKLDNTDLGNMFHETMEFVNEGKTKDEVLAEAEKIYNTVRAKRNPILNYELNKDKEEFIKMVTNGFNYLKSKPKGDAEQMLDMSLNIKGNTLYIDGKPDLISGNEIIDYKAKRKITHKDEDPISCIQALIYALMCREKNIDHVEYYYPLFKKTIKTTNNENNTIALLDEFYNSIAQSNFPAAYESAVSKDDEKKLNDICKYCKFDDICGKDKK